MISALLVGAFVVFYCSLVLRLVEKQSHYGPWPSKTRRVIWSQVVSADDYSGNFYREYTQPVTVFDWVRRLFGLYIVEVIPADPVKNIPKEELWYVRQEREEVWTCPICLSFWVAIPPAVLFALYSGNLLNVFLFTPAFAGGSVMLHRVIDFLNSVASLVEDNAVSIYTARSIDQGEDPDNTQEI
jgi:hypothetical protein